MLETRLRVSWKKLKSGLYIQKDLTPNIYEQGLFFRLKRESIPDIGEFNKELDKFGMAPISENDNLIDIMVKYNIFLSRKYNDGSFIPTNEQYVQACIDIAREAAKGDEESIEVLKTLKSGPAHITTDVLEFKEKISSGKNSGKYVADLHRFDRDGVLRKFDEGLTIAPDGYQKQLGMIYMFPIDTTGSKITTVRRIDPALPEGDMTGYWHTGEGKKSPVGEKRLVIRGPGPPSVGLLSASVSVDQSYSWEYTGAIRLRPEMPEDKK